ncbi:MAG: hypothetical protein GC131_02170 [Alphaproteobacteria bacterium]|nr:hypothetical protein [Alphaproteobacteria bacterium]
MANGVLSQDYGQEIEAKYLTDSPAGLECITNGIQHVSPAIDGIEFLPYNAHKAVKCYRVVTFYFDTPERDLFNAGLVLRFRTKN